MGKLFSILFIGLFSFTICSFERQEISTSKLTVLLDNIRNKEGNIFIFIYNYENQFPDNPFLHFEINKNLVSDFGTLKFIIPKSLTTGKYAVSILDDENANEDLDMFLGIPSEGYGFSNNVSPFFSLPNYDELLFDLAGNKKTIYLTLQYIL